MSESVMRQALTTWLKSECQEAGERLIYSLLAIDSATDSASKISDPGQLHTMVKSVENLVNAAVNDAVSLPPELLTVEERRKIFDTQEEIKRLLVEAERPGIHERPGMAATIIDKLYDLSLLTRKYLLEKVVECQVGKPPISYGKWEITIPIDIEALFTKGVITDNERSYLLLELHKGPFTIQEGKITRSGESGSSETTLEHSSLTDKWYNRGVEAGKTDTWMDIENTIKETAEHHPEIKEEADLVFTDVEQWKQTDHYRIKYGNQMWKDAPNEEVYPELEVMFWQGYIEGRKQIGKDIFAIASELVKGR